VVNVTITDTPTISIDVYSDVVCPWCYIGKRRFEAGLALAEAEDLGVEFEVSYRPFQLDPTAAPGVAGPVIEAYARKFGGMEQAEQILARVTSAAADEGLEFNMDRALRANTLLAHRLLWLADQPDSPVDQEILKERLLKAYFTDGVHIGDPDALAECAADVGFDRAEIEQFLESDRGVSEVEAELEEALSNGITAVPTYVLNGLWAIPGAQDPETFAQVLRKMAAKATESE
jgi:predicted DsbA family dithiol-disulfide isomerase